MRDALDLLWNDQNPAIGLRTFFKTQKLSLSSLEESRAREGRNENCSMVLLGAWAPQIRQSSTHTPSHRCQAEQVWTNPAQSRCQASPALSTSLPKCSGDKIRPALFLQRDLVIAKHVPLLTGSCYHLVANEWVISAEFPGDSCPLSLSSSLSQPSSLHWTLIGTLGYNWLWKLFPQEMGW